ncbi:hypothetical protein Baya_6799 [Bagarius yarrelli]|uniref:Uncharacterized protein n=1 Tax=Bagarius yarrelli TaxID=175774 RepID=A0A556TYV5_BAGYA|nr:hypothetical protein Baya_6799 [Bagarius yarrelli]
MNLEGLEMIAVLVVVVLFVKVLEQFGLLEASYDEYVYIFREILSESSAFNQTSRQSLPAVNQLNRDAWLLIRSADC